MKKILIAGGSGVIGTKIIDLLRVKGYQIVVLSRRIKKEEDRLRYAYWNMEKNIIDENALIGVDHIINLAGANLANGRWTEKRKKQIIESRTKSTTLLSQKIKELNAQPESFISASAVGYYGVASPSAVFREQSPPGTDFLAQVCTAWEKALLPVKDAGIRTASLRIGLVISKEGGLLRKVLPLARKSLNANFGSGKQIYPWIHIEDVARMFVYAIENPAISGAYNATVNEEAQRSQKEFNQLLGSVLNKNVILPVIPTFLLKLALGEMSSMLLSGSKVSNEKIRREGFVFNFPELKDALDDLI